ncbi:hypothetical protein BH20BAC1_BH20BAC1_25090 [soil metagenome]
MYKKRTLLYSLIALLIFCSSFSVVAQANDSLLSQLTRKWKNSKAYALEIAEKMPAEFYPFKPVPEQMSFQEQLLHIADNIQWLSSSFLFVEKNNLNDEKTEKNKAAVIKYLSDAYDMGIAAHQNIKANQLEDSVSFFSGPMTRRQIFILLHDHQSHHIGQLIVYLRLKGIKPPGYVGW